MRRKCNNIRIKVGKTCEAEETKREKKNCTLTSFDLYLTNFAYFSLLIFPSNLFFLLSKTHIRERVTQARDEKMVNNIEKFFYQIYVQIFWN